MNIKQMLIDSGQQNDAILIVDERIYRLCIQVFIPTKLQLFFIFRSKMKTGQISKTVFLILVIFI
jgi:hypothetical protein